MRSIKKIRTELCYPYLSKNGIIGVYKKLKKRQYRKIQQKQFRQFYEQTVNLKPQQFAKEQRDLYEKQLSTNRNTLFELFKSFSILEDNLKTISIGVNFQLDKNYEQKIRSVFDSINLQKKNEQEDQIKEKFEDIAVIQNKKIQKQLSKQSLNNSLTHKWASSGNTGRKKSLEIINKDESLPKHIQKKELKKSREQLDQMKNDIVNLMSNKKDDQIIFDLTVTAPSQATRVKTLNSQCSSRQNLDAKLLPLEVNKNYLTVDVKPVVSSSIQSLALSDKLGNKFKEKFQTNQITQVKHNKLPSQAGQNLGCQEKQRKKPSDLRLVVVPFKADKPLEPSQLSPLLQKRKKFFASQNKQSDKKQQGFLLVPVKEQSPTKQQTVKTPEKPVKPQTSVQQQKSIQLLTDAVQVKGQDAIPLLKIALKQAPNNLSAAQYLSFLFLQSGSIKQCLKVCNDIQDQLQDQMIYQHSLFHINNNKAVALLLLGRYSQAIICLQKSLADQQNPLTYKNLGDAYYSIGIYEKAVFYYQKSINLKQSGQTYYNLAVCLYIQQNFNNSLIMAELAVKHSPQIKEYSILVKQIKNNI